MNNSIDKQINEYKKEIMKLLNMQEWGVIDLFSIDENTNLKVKDLLLKIKYLQKSQIALNSMESDLKINIENIKKAYKKINQKTEESEI